MNQRAAQCVASAFSVLLLNALLQRAAERSAVQVRGGTDSPCTLTLQPCGNLGWYALEASVAVPALQTGSWGLRFPGAGALVQGCCDEGCFPPFAHAAAR